MDREKKAETCIEVTFPSFLYYHLKNNTPINNHLSCFKNIYHKLSSKNSSDIVCCFIVALFPPTIL